MPKRAFVKSFSEEKGDVGAEQKCNCSIILHTEFGFLKCAAANLIDGTPGALRCSSPSAKKLKPAKPLRFEVVRRLLPEFY